MGLYEVKCSQCQKPFMWFSGNNLDQRCEVCRICEHKNIRYDSSFEFGCCVIMCFCCDCNHTVDQTTIIETDVQEHLKELFPIFKKIQKDQDA